MVVRGKGPEGGVVGRVIVSLAGREHDGEIVDRPYDGDRGLQVLAVCWA